MRHFFGSEPMFTRSASLFGLSHFARSGCLILLARQQRGSHLPGLRPITKTSDAGAASQPKRRDHRAVQRAIALTVTDLFALIPVRPLPPTGRAVSPYGHPRVVGHEKLRVTKGLENATPPTANHIKRYSCGVFGFLRRQTHFRTMTLFRGCSCCRRLFVSRWSPRSEG